MSKFGISFDNEGQGFYGIYITWPDGRISQVGVLDLRQGEAFLYERDQQPRVERALDREFPEHGIEFVE